MNEVSIFSKAGLPAVTDLASSLRSLSVSVGSTGVAIMKMDKTGHWVYGAEQTEAEPEATWAVNPFSFTHGYIAWGDGVVLSEKMVSVTDPLPALEPAPAGCKRGWESQIGFSLKCLTGEDKDLEARFTATSTGGKKAAHEIALSIAGQVDKDPSKPIPVIRLEKALYQHKTYGRIYVPVFKIVDWLSSTPAEDTMTISSPEEALIETTQGTARRRRVVG